MPRCESRQRARAASHGAGATAALNALNQTGVRAMETMLSLCGVFGAMCCVSMFAAVSFGKISAEKPLFFIVNGLGSILILVGAMTEFDMGDAGAIGQELIWAAISFAGGFRAWSKAGGLAKA